MYYTGAITTLLIGGLIAAVASSDDDILCYLQKIESELHECCKKIGDGNGKPSRTRDPDSIGSTPIKTITGFSGPFNLYFTDDGTAYLTEYYGHKIRTLDSKGNKLKVALISEGAPKGLHVKDGVVYIALLHSKKVVKYSASDLTTIGESLTTQFPIGVAVDSKGNIYANEHNSGFIYVYDKDGSKIRTIRPSGGRALRFDANENLYSSRISASTIYVSTKEGENVKTIKLSGIGMAEGPFVDDNGNIYQPDRTNGMVYILNSSGTIIKQFQSAAKGASDAVIAPDGTLWVVDFSGNAIYLY